MSVLPVLACPSSFAHCQRPSGAAGLLSPAERGAHVPRRLGTPSC